MTGERRLHRRQRLRRRDIDALNSEMMAQWSMSPFPPEGAVDTGSFENTEVYLVANVIMAFRDEGAVFPTVHLLMKLKPAAKFVTVDMGAVKFVCNGADVMAPGVVEADPSIAEGGGAWIRDQRNGAPLAVGRAIVAGAGMRGSKGKVVKTLHFVGDRLWNYEP